MAAHKYKLIYFDGRGRAEVSRYIFKLAGVDFEDVRFGFDGWPKIKPSTPYGQVPVLEVDGTPYCDSVAIHRFVARQFGYYGKDNLEGLQIDQILGVVRDSLEEAAKIIWDLPDGEQKTKAGETFKSQSAPKIIKFLDAQLGQKKWFLGDNISLADVVVYEFLTNVLTRLAGAAWQTESPALKALVDNFAALPAIAKHVSERGETAF